MAELFDPIDFYPDRGMYKPGEPVRLTLKLHTDTAGEMKVLLRITHSESRLMESNRRVDLAAGTNEIVWYWTPPLRVPAGYGADLFIDSPETLTLHTAFDVLADWTTSPRYGFLCDFSKNRTDISETIAELSRYHLNGLQFYDWQYRHDQLVPPVDDYGDPLGRSLSLTTVRRFIQSAHAAGMAAMPYLAIYAASAVFWKAHPDWALYDSAGKMIPFGEDFLGIMNPEPGGPWQTHLLNECARVLESLPFDGLHIDQYGDPKTGSHINGAPVDIPAAFADMIVRCRENWPERPVVFNAVGNWPIESLAAAPVSFNYIEIWPPDTGYADITRIVRSARRLSRGKPVVIALYLPADRPVNILLADALIVSAGGSRIELGERTRLLADPYFPKHQEMTAGLKTALRRYADFAVRYENWIGAFLPDADAELSLPDQMEGTCRRTDTGVGISLVNLNGVTPARWDAVHLEPGALSEFTIKVKCKTPVQSVWGASPDGEDPSAVPLHFTQTGEHVEVRIPGIKTWYVLHLYDSSLSEKN
jgi:dextranase